MTKRGEYRVVVAAMLGSVAVHAVVAVLAFRGGERRLERREEVAVVELEMLPLEVVPPPAAPPEQAPRLLPRDPRSREQAMAQPESPRPTVEPTTPVEVAAVAPPPDPLVVETTNPTPGAISVVQQPRGLNLDPHAVALAALPIDMSRPTVRSAGTGAADATSAGERSAALSRDLREAANARAYLTNRPPPELHRRSDGSYVYNGPRFTAAIAPDGTISYSDRNNVGMDGFASVNSGRDGLGGHFDLSDAMHRRHGSDPYAAERRWFMSETEELRNQLADSSRGARATTGARTIRGRLQRIWEDVTRSPEQRRFAIFRIWDECSEDETGETVRAAIVGFVRDRLPAGTDDGFTGAELARLNARRESGGPFAPYTPTARD